MFKHSNGFSLIELLVVVALLVVLAALAVPQVIAYGESSANAAAAADIRNASMAEKAFFADWGVYASSAPGAYPGVGMVMTNFANSTGQIWATGINGTAPSRTIPAPGFQISVSQNVGIVINTSVMGGSHTLVAKNTMGDRYFGMDSDSKVVYWTNGLLGYPLISTAAPVPIAGGDDFDGVSGAGSCLGYPPGQITWVAL